MENLESKINSVLEKRKELKALLPTFEDDALLTMAMMDVFRSNGQVKQVEKLVDHEEFVQGIKENVIPANDKRNYNAKTLRKMRLDKGISQSYVERKLGWTRMTISNIEAGRRSYLPPDQKTALISLYQS